jgi:lysophospholipase L1-like esterase
MKNPSIVLFGDSYTAGRLPGTNADGAFRAALEASGARVVADYALSGSTAVEWSMGLGGRLDAVCANQADVAVGTLLGNDALAAIADGQITAGEALPALASLALVLHRIATYSPVLLMLYPNPFQGKRPDVAEGVIRLNTAITTVAHAVNGMLPPGGPVMLLPLGPLLGAEHFDWIDIHPKASGYAAMAAAVLATIDRM